MAVITYARIFIYLIVFFAAIGVLGVSANILAIGRSEGLYDRFADYAEAVSVVTVVCLLIGLIIGGVASCMGRSCFAVWTVFELIFLAILWILWMSSAAYTTSIIPNVIAFSGSCKSDSIAVQNLYTVLGNISLNEAVSICQQIMAVFGLSWGIFGLLLIAWVWILIHASTRHARGHKEVWTTQATPLYPGQQVTGTKESAMQEQSMVTA